jgi:hypothetical protein
MDIIGNLSNTSASGLMGPEITQYLIKITAELADILGIALYEVK